MMNVRLIKVSSENGDVEDVIFTDDFECKAEDWCSPGQTVDFDKVIDADLPFNFPLNYTLRRR